MPPPPGPEGALTTSYAAYGRNLLSEMTLPELEPVAGPPDIVIRVAPGPPPLQTQTRRPLLDEQGEVWLVVSESPEGTVLSFPGAGDFVVDLESRGITCHQAEGADPGGVRHALLDHVVPRLLAGTGSTVLHASGVVVGKEALLFAGPSQAGKSTLAARCAAAGYSVLADDAMVLERAGERWRALPGYPGLRLWRDSIDLVGTMGETTPLAGGSPKSRVVVPTVEATPYELAAIVLIERRPGPTIGRRLAGAEAFSSLWGVMFAWPSVALDGGLLDRVTALANDAVVLRIGFDDRAEVEEILDAVARLSAGR